MHVDSILWSIENETEGQECKCFRQLEQARARLVYMFALIERERVLNMMHMIRVQHNVTGAEKKR